MGIKWVYISNYRSFPFGAPPQRFPSEHEGNFSSSVNIIVGPNGAGKTNFLNAIRKCFDRGTYTSQTQYGESVSDFYDPNQPIYIEISFEDVLGIEGILLYHRPSPDPGSDERVLNGKKVDIKSKKWKEIKKHMFPSSFPRRIDNEFARHIAFDGDPLTNWQAINKAWKDIREDAERFIRLKLAEEPPLAECPHSEQPASQYASDLRDENDKPLLEGSDGYSHFLYLIMEIRKHRWPTVFLIEEPDVFMHPGLQKGFLDYLLYVSERARHQFFISTHSPYLLDFALRSGRRDSSPHVYRIFKQNGQSRLRFMNPKDRSDAWEILRALGHSSADVLHPNGIIWVEGPSDKIYLQTWLDCFAQKNMKKINWGVDCDIVWYGGSNLAHLDVNFWEKAEEDDIGKLLDLLKINPQAAILVDRDNLVDCSDLSSDRMAKHKCRVKKRCKEEDIFFWMIEEGKRTIEDYIPDIVQKNANFAPKGGKVANARKYQAWVEKEKAYDNVIPPNSHLEKQIGQLYDKIVTWRGN
jgi:predicted ATP-dependent endonuclease of OLD family